MINNLSDYLGHITGEITVIGGTMASMDSLATSNQDINTFTTNLRDDISAVDYPEAYIRMNESMAAASLRCKCMQMLHSYHCFHILSSYCLRNN